MVDPKAVAHAKSVGPGGMFEFAVGGKRDHIFSRPLAVTGKVISLQPARYLLCGHMGNKLPIDMGLSATVCIGDVTLLLVEYPGPGSSPMMYRCVGLEPKNFKIVIVKSPAGFRAEFEPFAADIILSALASITAGNGVVRVHTSQVGGACVVSADIAVLTVDRCPRLAG